MNYRFITLNLFFSVENGKDDLSEQQFVISAVEKPVLSTIGTSYINTVDGAHLQPLPPLKKVIFINKICVIDISLQFLF